MSKSIPNVAALLLLLFMVVQYAREKDGSIPALIAAVACLFFANIDSIKSFQLSGMGFQAETREVVREARDTIEQTKLLATELAKFALLVINAEGRMGGGIDLDKKREASDRILQTLRDLHVDEREVTAVADVEYAYVCFDFPFYITLGIHRRLDQTKLREWDDFFAANKRKGIGHEPSPDELRRFLASVGLLTPQLAELIEDYNYYRQNHRQRRPEIWATREHWNE